VQNLSPPHRSHARRRQKEAVVSVGNPLARNPFTYRAWDVTTLTPLDHLPYQAVTFGATLNQPGTWSGSLPIADPAVWQLDWQDATRPSRTLLGIEYLGQLLPKGYLLWTRTYQESQKILKIGASEIGSYMQHRLQAFDYTATWAGGGDPMSIVGQLMEDALAVYGSTQMCGGISVQLNPARGSGQSVVVSYPASSLQTIDSMVQTLSQMGFTLGIDYSFEMSYIPGTQTPQITATVWYPRKGRTYAQSQIRVQARQCTDWYYPEDGTQQANKITVAGSGTGGVQPVSENIQPLMPEYPLLESTSVHTQVNTQEELVGIAAGEIGLKAWPVVTPWITLPIALPRADGTTDPAVLQLGEFVEGDDLLFAVDPVTTGPAGEPQWSPNNSPRFPNGTQVELRIQDWTVNVADKGVSTLKLDLGIPPGEAQPPPQPPLE
jgi:hypothetical protein